MKITRVTAQKSKAKGPSTIMGITINSDTGHNIGIAFAKGLSAGCLHYRLVELLDDLEEAEDDAKRKGLVKTEKANFEPRIDWAKFTKP